MKTISRSFLPCSSTTILSSVVALLLAVSGCSGDESGTNNGASGNAAASNGGAAGNSGGSSGASAGGSGGGSSGNSGNSGTSGNAGTSQGGAGQGGGGGAGAGGALTGAFDVAAGNYYSCALMNNGDTRCWGGNGPGYLGLPVVENAPSPQFAKIQGIDSPSTIVANDNICVLTKNHEMLCWGSNKCSSITSGLAVTSPFLIPLANIASMDTNSLHSCAATTSGTTYCWGQWCVGHPTDIFWAGDSPTNMGALNGAKSVVIGPASTAVASAFFILRDDGTVYETSAAYSYWTESGGVVGLQDIIQVFGGSALCALQNTGKVFCASITNTHGEVGGGVFGNTGDSAQVVEVVGISDAISISSGHSASPCAVLGDHTVKCWGQNDKGQLGTGDTTDRNIPTKVVGLSGVVKVAGGLKHTCAVLENGDVMCWGDNTTGQLGDGTTTSSLVPVKVDWSLWGQLCRSRGIVSASPPSLPPP